MATSVQMPKQGNTVEECLLVEWRVGEGDSVAAGDVLCSIETDKASFEVESTASGIVLKLLASAGDLIPVLTDIAVIGQAGEAVDSAAPAAPETPKGNDAPAAASPVATSALVPATPKAATGSTDGRKPVSPRARALAKKLGVDATTIDGGGIGGRVTSRDVRTAVDSGRLTKVSPLAREIMAADGTVPGVGSGVGGLCLAQDLRQRREAATALPGQQPEVVPYKGIRKLIGDRMLQSLAEHAQLTHNASADATGLMTLRAAFKENAEALGLPKITINDLLCWTVVRTLTSFPELNTIFDRDAATLTRHHDVNLAFAVDTPRGLMVPVVEKANRLGLADLSRAMAGRAEECRKGSINPDHLAGGTFTVSNLGAFGIESFTPIINGNQVAILGVCAITTVPVPAPGGGVSFAPRIGLSLTYDHMAVDGGPASRFLQAVAKGIGEVQSTLALYGSF